jgi:hypothetical protein
MTTNRFRRNDDVQDHSEHDGQCKISVGGAQIRGDERSAFVAGYEAAVREIAHADATGTLDAMGLIGAQRSDPRGHALAAFVASVVASEAPR